MNYSLQTRCNGSCDPNDNGHRNYQTPIPEIEPENNYNVVLTEIFETSGQNGCTTSVKSREVLLNLTDFNNQVLSTVLTSLKFKSPDDNVWSVSVDNSGTLVVVAA